MTRHHRRSLQTTFDGSPALRSYETGCRTQNAGPLQRPTGVMIPASARPSHDKVTHLTSAEAAAKRARSAGWPGEFAAGEHVEVQVRHRLARLVAVVHNELDVLADLALPDDAAD